MATPATPTSIVKPKGIGGITTPHPATVLRQRLNQPGIITMPGAYNAMTARMIQQNGFEAVYITGAGLINSMTGYPDIGMLSVTEVTQLAGNIADAVSIPCICDADTGFGESLQITRTIQLFEKAGIAGVHLEDQVMPKRCGHLDGKQVVTIEQMQTRIASALAARQNPDFMVIARVDARAIEGLDAAITRAKAYVEAGADMIFAEAMQSREEFEAMSRALPNTPLLANMTEFGKSPYLSAADFEALGYKVVIFPMTLFRLMMHAAQEMLGVLKRDGSQQAMLDKMQTRQSLYDVIDYSAYNALDKALGEAFASRVN